MPADDISAIEALIDRQFRSLNWAEGGTGNWAQFTSDFFCNAALYPAARPAQSQPVFGFVERMKSLARTSLRSFNEKMLGTQIKVFGNIAVALASCQMIENEITGARAVEAMLLIKNEGAWKIVAQAWDSEGSDKIIPDDLIS